MKFIESFKDPQLTGRSRDVFQARNDANYRDISKLFAYLLIVQWIAGIVLALTISPITWEGKSQSINVHVPVALLLGGLLTVFPCFLAFKAPTHTLTRHTLVASQMLWSALLIHLTGGRIETHFHVFCSLGFFVAFRDWKVFITATLVVATEHIARSFLWPESIYGIANPAWWRVFEHAWWVIFADIFLIFLCIKHRDEAALLAVNEEKLLTTLNEEQARGKTIEESVAFLMAASNDLKDSAASQKTALEQVSVTTDELNATAEQNSSISSSVNKKVNSSLVHVSRSNQDLLNLSEAVRAIESSSSEIQNINNLVNEIAYQTNLLSLNAMIEASRIGDGNGGFKVVALEVKKLSERASEAAESINVQLNDNANNIRSLSQTLEEVLSRYKTMSEEISELTNGITDIINASNEQKEAISQITLGLQNIDTSVDKHLTMASSASDKANNMQALLSKVNQ